MLKDFQVFQKQLVVILSAFPGPYVYSTMEMFLFLTKELIDSLSTRE